MQLKERLTYANVLTTILAFVVLGSGTAVALEGKNTVDSGDVINKTLRGKDVRDGGLTGADVAPDSLGGAEINEGSLAKVPDADRIDGVDSSQLARTSDIPADDELTLEARLSLPADDTGFADNTTLFTVPGLGPISVRCQTNDSLVVDFVNQSGAQTDVYGQVSEPGAGLTGGDYDLLSNGAGEQLATINTAAVLVAQLSSRTSTRIATVTVTLVSTSDATPGCAIAGQAVVSGG